MQDDLYERVTNRIVAAIEAGVKKGGRMPWHITDAACFSPVNVVSRKHYRGMNMLNLWVTAEYLGYDSGLWGTYQQWSNLGAQVRKGEKSSIAIFWSSINKKPDEPDDKKRRFFAKAYSVFNAAQVDNYTPPATPQLSETERRQNAEEFFGNIGIDVRHGGSEAFYRVKDDFIQMPPFKSFREGVGYYSTLAHETTHWTGAKSRLARDLTGRFRSEAYAAEELIAELGAAFCCASLGLSVKPREDHARYIATWLKILRDDKKAIFTAASQAQQAVDFMFGTDKSEEIAPEPE